MKDYIIRATAGNGSVPIFVATTRTMVETARSLHKTTAVATAALGRLLTAASMMGASLKNDTDIITITLKGEGPIGGIVATTDHMSRVKGYAYNPQIPHRNNALGKLDVGGALGAGSLTVVKDLGLKQPVSGQIELISGEIAEDLTYYFAVSEQLPSSVALGVLVDRDYSVKQAGGYIVQIMPNAQENIITHLEHKLPKLPSVTTMLEAGKSPEEILSLLFEGFDLEIYEKIYPEFYCNCSAEKTRKVLLSIGQEELSLILKEDRGANIHCHFCNKDYYFKEDDIRKMLSEISDIGRA